jgi:hypothetical protein
MLAGPVQGPGKMRQHTHLFLAGWSVGSEELLVERLPHDAVSAPLQPAAPGGPTTHGTA